MPLVETFGLQGWFMDGTMVQLTLRQRSQLCAGFQIERGEGFQAPNACNKFRINMTDQSLWFAWVVHVDGTVLHASDDTLQVIG